MTSRLDRLLGLLQYGSTPTVRATAARQLGALAAQRVKHPSASLKPVTSTELAVYRGTDGEWNDVVLLLNRVLPLLRNKQWETRQAAAQAIECICRDVGIWDPTHSESDSAVLQPSAGDPVWTLRLADFDLLALLSTTSILLASSGTEYAGAKHNTDNAAAQKNVMADLGLSMDLDGDMGLDFAKELAAGGEAAGSVAVKKEEPDGLPVVASGPSALSAKAVSMPVQPAVDEFEGLSARERNALKRKRKAGNVGPAPPAK